MPLRENFDWRGRDTAEVACKSECHPPGVMIPAREMRSSSPGPKQRLDLAAATVCLGGSSPTYRGLILISLDRLCSSASWACRLVLKLTFRFLEIVDDIIFAYDLPPGRHTRLRSMMHALVLLIRLLNDAILTVYRHSTVLSPISSPYPRRQ